MNANPRKIKIKVTDLERKVLADLTERRDHLKSHYEKLKKAIEETENTRNYSSMDTTNSEAKNKIQQIISENKLLESYIRGEYYNSADDAIAAYKYNLEGKEQKLKGLEDIITQLKTVFIFSGNSRPDKHTRLFFRITAS